MKYELMNNNKVFLTGVVINQPIFSHETYGEGFYEVKMSVPRFSNNVDILPITVSEKMLDSFEVGKEITVKGQFRSFNEQQENAKSRLILNVFAREVIEKDNTMNPNIIEINGYICKAPIYRTTPFNREICDMLVAVNRAYNKSDYLPCIAWGRNARYIKDVKVGTRVQVVGRIQSRDYQKKLDNGEIISKTAYEISVNRVTIDGDEINHNENFNNIVNK